MRHLFSFLFIFVFVFSSNLYCQSNDTDELDWLMMFVNRKIEKRQHFISVCILTGDIDQYYYYAVGQYDAYKDAYKMIEYQKSKRSRPGT